AAGHVDPLISVSVANDEAFGLVPHYRGKALHRKRLQRAKPLNLPSGRRSRDWRQDSTPTRVDWVMWCDLLAYRHLSFHNFKIRPGQVVAAKLEPQADCTPQFALGASAVGKNAGLQTPTE